MTRDTTKATLKMMEKAFIFHVLMLWFQSYPITLFFQYPFQEKKNPIKLDLQKKKKNWIYIWIYYHHLKKDYGIAPTMIQFCSLFPPLVLFLCFFVCCLYPTTSISQGSTSFHYISIFYVWVGMRGKNYRRWAHNKQQMLAICGAVKKCKLNMA